MSVYIDTQTRAKISDIQNFASQPFAVDPNGVQRNLNIGDLIYSTDIVHISIMPGASNANGNPSAIYIMGRLDNTWALERGLEISWEDSGGQQDNRKRWFALTITGTANNSQVQLNPQPDFSTPRSW